MPISGQYFTLVADARGELAYGEPACEAYKIWRVEFVMVPLAAQPQGSSLIQVKCDIYSATSISSEELNGLVARNPQIES